MNDDHVPHTPGPWGIRSRHESLGEHSTVTRFVEIPGWDYIEVSILTNPSPARDDEARANVRLIAAVPELKTELADLLDFLTTGASGEAIAGMLLNYPGMQDALNEHIEIARAIVNKVEGRS